jgi:hypothetical protein
LDSEFVYRKEPELRRILHVNTFRVFTEYG